MSEFLYPLLTLWRREVPDSGGPGRHRGGLGASIAMIPHGTNVPMGLVLASAGKAVSQNTGLCGGYPGNTGLDVVARNSRVMELLASGAIPSELDEISDDLEPAQNYASSYLAPGEVFAMTWQGGGGYGDPLTREPRAVANDLREQKITEASATALYGVVLDRGDVDEAATAAERDRRLALRRQRSRIVGIARGKADLATARRLDDNLVETRGVDGGTSIACRHCAELLGGTGADDRVTLAVYEGPPTDAGPQIIAESTHYVDAAVVFRQYCCPGCWTALYSSVVPAEHPHHLATTLGGQSAELSW
jgi:N-methylhydantoinase B